MNRVFIDTSAFVALRNKSEREHRRARQALQKLQKARAQLFTSNYVFSETYTVLLVRVGRSEAVEWGRKFRQGSVIELLRVDEETEDAAWNILEHHSDKRYSYVDATSFALMEKYNIEHAFVFDCRFDQYGITTVQ